MVEYQVPGGHKEDETLLKFPSLALSPDSLKNLLITDWPPRYPDIWKQVLNRRAKQVSQEYYCENNSLGLKEVQCIVAMSRAWLV